MRFYLLWRDGHLLPDPQPVNPKPAVRWVGPWGYEENGNLIKAIYVRTLSLELARRFAAGLEES